VGVLPFVALWELTVRAGAVPRYVLPAPVDVWHAIWGDAAIWSGFLDTLLEVVLGFGLALGIGVPLATAVVSSVVLGRMFMPLILLTQSIPKVAIAPILVVALGYGIRTQVVVAFLVAFFPIVIDTATGLRSPSRDLLDLAEQLSATRWQVYQKIKFPAALPHVLSGAKVAVTLSVIGAVIGEFVGSESGLGYQLLAATARFDGGKAYACIVLLSVMSMVLFGLVSLLERLLVPWFGRS
jgi:NitT/TauT family transport system permease protein